MRGRFLTRQLLGKFWLPVLLLACSGLMSALATSLSEECRSQGNTVQWRTSTKSRNSITSTASSAPQQQRSLQQKKSGVYSCHRQSLDSAKRQALGFLRDHVMEFDKAKLNTLGFGARNGTDDDPDGLDKGLVGTTIDLAFQAKLKHPWTDALPQEIFYEYVLNYANLNEARSNWRQLLWDILDPLVVHEQQLQLTESQSTTASDTLTLNDVVRLVNQKLWSAFPGDNTIYFRSGQTPLIFDPLSVIAFGYASCTGLAILLVNALRTVGVAARVVGTPAWNGKRDKGNHNWVEVYHEGEWTFLEPSANQTHVNDLETQPCSFWFCNPGHFPSAGDNTTNVYAARLVFSSKDSYCPMAWEWDCRDVPGEDRTEFYQRSCSQC
ncbi:Transglutaminase-like superfamily [Seminavis robusta]|uniref:Transglutaminase-like superfamily n=1 Tax=Seminavis robusta TaxID=568900 RepID=A0A9N8E3C2_9STRA|nr:Transglutaminase-like superfamily [Seminavis robusta]|eukprot:Sro576_g169450.1 Transglutaminase-like superfamily (381) ;mRNA; f:3461-4603